MWCEQREHLLAEYQKAMAERTALADRDRIIESSGKDSPVDYAIVAIAEARLNLREHVDEHRCWSHAVYSALFFLWRNQSTDARTAVDEHLRVAS
jgi:transketolase